MSTTQLIINVPTDRAVAIGGVLGALGVSIESPTESEAVDSDPTPPHGTLRDGSWVVPASRYQELLDAEKQRDQLRGRVEEMRDSNNDMRRQCDALRSRVEEMRKQLAQLTVAETHRNQLLGEVAELRRTHNQTIETCEEALRDAYDSEQSLHQLRREYDELHKQLLDAEKQRDQLLGQVFVPSGHVTLTRERHRELLDAERQRDQLLGQVVAMRRTYNRIIEICDDARAHTSDGDEQ